MRKCKKHEIVICNEADNNGKFYCRKCGVIPKSQTYTNSDSESAPQGKNSVGGSSPDEIEITGMSSAEIVEEFKGNKFKEFFVDNRGNKIFMVRKGMEE